MEDLAMRIEKSHNEAITTKEQNQDGISFDDNDSSRTTVDDMEEKLLKRSMMISVTNRRGDKR